METITGTYYLHYDQVGSLRAVTDSTGLMVKRIDYDSYGNVVSDSNPAFAVPFGFAGGLYDRDTGLTRFGYRDYDPALGRWTAKDAIDFAGVDVNLYGYVLGDPVSVRDPYGTVSLGTVVVVAATALGLYYFYDSVVEYLSEARKTKKMLEDLNMQTNANEIDAEACHDAYLKHNRHLVNSAKRGVKVLENAPATSVGGPPATDPYGAIIDMLY